jgi:hypothetical protein
VSYNFVLIVFNNFQHGEETLLGSRQENPRFTDANYFLLCLPDSANWPFLNQINSLYAIIQRFLSTEFSNIIVRLRQMLRRAYPNFQLSSTSDFAPLQARKPNGTRSLETRSGSVGPPIICFVTKTTGKARDNPLYYVTRDMESLREG